MTGVRSLARRARNTPSRYGSIVQKSISIANRMVIVTDPLTAVTGTFECTPRSAEGSRHTPSLANGQVRARAVAPSSPPEAITRSPHSDKLGCIGPAGG